MIQERTTHPEAREHGNGTGSVYNVEPPLPEAPASANTHLEINGRRCQITLRDHDESHLLDRLAALLARFPSESPPDIPANPRVPTNPTPVNDWCDIHQVVMQEHENARGTWFSHHLEDQDRWCKGNKGRGK
jgi:hypothetical protein